MPLVRVVRQQYAILFESIVEVVDIGHGLSAYRLTQGSSVHDDVPMHAQHVARRQSREGVARTKDILAFNKGRITTLPVVRGVYVLNEVGREMARLKGLSALVEEFAKVYPKSTLCQSDVFSVLAQSPDKKFSIARLDFDSNMMFSLAGEVIATAIFCDYISAGFHNGNYDLVRLAVHLANDTRVHFIDSSQTPHVPTTAAKAVKSLPDYSARGGRGTYVEFFFAPTDDDMRAVWAKMQSYGPLHPSTSRYQAMFELDILGLRKAGIALHDSFYPPAEAGGHDENADR